MNIHYKYGLIMSFSCSSHAGEVCQELSSLFRPSLTCLLVFPALFRPGFGLPVSLCLAWIFAFSAFQSFRASPSD